MATNKRKQNPAPHPLKGQLVYVALKDGGYCYGKVAGVRNGQLLLEGAHGQGRYDRMNQEERAQISGFLGSMLGGLGGAGGLGGLGGVGGLGGLGGAGAGAGAAAGAGGGLLGTIGRFMPLISVGMNMVRFIMPLLGKFAI